MKATPYVGPEVLYHYTNLDGLRGILSSLSLWVSDVRFMNDTSEYLFAVKLMANKLRSIADRVPLKFTAELRAMERTVRSATATVFAFCLTPDGDKLSQWRAYGSCCLSFDGKLLDENAANAGLSLAPVLYARFQQIELLDGIEYDAVIGSKASGATNSAKVAKLYGSLFLNRAAPFIKHPGFYEEGEWRIATVRSGRRAIHFKSRNGDRIAYMVMPLRNARHLFARIIVGPSRQQSRLVRDVKRLCDDLRLKIEISASETPYSQI